MSSSVRAHDLYEITSVVYLRSNQIELFVEMEFPTGMKLAGATPSREITLTDQFEAALPRLQTLAGGFFEFTAGNNAVLPLQTNVELAVEDHIRFHLEFATTPYRPLRFTAVGLRELAQYDSFYGTSLTVLDMVNRKVLGQETLFADSSAAEFPPPDVAAQIEPQAKPAQETVPSNAAVNLPSASVRETNAVAVNSEPTVSIGRRFWMLLVAVIVVFIPVLWLSSKRAT